MEKQAGIIEQRNQKYVRAGLLAHGGPDPRVTRSRRRCFYRQNADGDSDQYKIIFEALALVGDSVGAG